ncbi:hypothetical protein ACQRIU_001313 [Beauveria bassiana]
MHTSHAAELFQLTMPFNEDVYKQKLIDWTIKLRLSYREVTSEATIDLLKYGKPSLARLLPTHHSTLSQWVKDSMAARLPSIVDLVQSALSNINLSIDGWRAHNRREYAAVSVTVATEHVDRVETPPSSPTIDDEFDAWGHTTDRPRRGKRRKIEPEWELWMKQVPSKDDMSVKNPLAWWVDRRHTWLILSKLAFNVFSTPAMSAEPERVFSDGSELITDKRNGLGDDTVEAEMIQKNRNLECVAGNGRAKGCVVRIT